MTPEPGQSTDHWYTVWGFYVTLGGLIIAFIAAMFNEEFRTGFANFLERTLKWIRTYWLFLTLSFLSIAILGQVYVRPTRGNLNGIYLALLTVAVVLALAYWVGWEFSRRIRYEKCDGCRWEQLRAVKYSHLEYEPLLDKHAGSSAGGFGVKLLAELLKETPIGALSLSQDGDWRNWATVLDGLSPKGQSQVLATPIFATFERSKAARFTAPLFYSNIGLYMTEQTRSACGWVGAPQTIQEVMLSLKNGGAKKLTFLCIEGEISEKLARKYVKSKYIKASKASTAIASLFYEMRHSNEPYAIFSESYSADNYLSDITPVVNKRISNLLAHYQILYPVCYAVRMGDYQLANLINLRLLDRMRGVDSADSEDDSFPKHPLQMLVEELQDNPINRLTEKQIRQHFVDHWPFPQPPSKEISTHA